MERKKLITVLLLSTFLILGLMAINFSYNLTTDIPVSIHIELKEIFGEFCVLGNICKVKFLLLVL